MTQDELKTVTQEVIAELKKNGTNIADASVVSDISQVNNLVAYGKNGKVIKVTPQTIQESVVKHVAWNDSSRLNDFTAAGVYEITGERKMSSEYDNLPIENSGGGHTISARLEVLDSSINDTTNSDDKCITQKLTLSNRVGGDGNVYIRTGRGRTYDSITWEKWGTLQTNINVGQVRSLDEFVDNGIYSGVWTDGSSFAQTFVMVVINDYAVAVGNKTIVQYKYAYDTLKGNGEPTYNTRSLFGGVWSDWEDTQVDDLGVLKEELLNAINLNKKNIDNNSNAIVEEVLRATKAEKTLQKNIDNTNNIVGIEEKGKLTVYIGAVMEDGSTYSTNNSAYTNAFEGGDIAVTNEGYFIYDVRKVSADGVAEMVIVKSRRLRTEKGYTYQLNISKDGNGAFSNDELEGIVRLYNYDSSEIEKNKTDIQYLFEEAVKFDSFEVEELGDGIGINYDTFDGNSGSVEIPFATEEKAGVMSAADKKKLDNLSEGSENVDTDVVGLPNDKEVIYNITDGRTKLTGTGAGISQNYWYIADKPIQDSGCRLKTITFQHTANANKNYIIGIFRRKEDIFQLQGYAQMTYYGDGVNGWHTEVVDVYNSLPYLLMKGDYIGVMTMTYFIGGYKEDVPVGWTLPFSAMHDPNNIVKEYAPTATNVGLWIDFTTTGVDKGTLYSYELSKERFLTINTPTPREKMYNCTKDTKIFLLGDSIASDTAIGGTTADHNYDGWQKSLAELLGIPKSNIIRAGMPGLGAGWFSGDATWETNGVKSVRGSNPDIIISIVGANDSGEPWTVGTFSGVVEGEPICRDIPFSEATQGQYGSIGAEYFIQNVSWILQRYLNTYYDLRTLANITDSDSYEDVDAKMSAVKRPRLIICTTLPQNRGGDKSYYSKPENWKRKRDAIVEVCNKYNIECVDLLEAMPWDYTKEPVFTSAVWQNKGIYTMDGLHPNRAGFKVISEIICNQAGLVNEQTAVDKGRQLALRSLFIAAGAEYNDTDSHIIKDTPWKNYVDDVEYKAQWNLDVVNGSVQTLTHGGNTYEYVDDNGTWKIIARVGDKLIWDDTKVIHRKGYYYLNGLGDITESQMMDIYSKTFIYTHSHWLGNFLRGNYSTRTNYRPNTEFNGNSNTTIDITYALYGSKKCEVFVINHKMETSANIIGVFHQSDIKHVVGVLKPLDNYTNFLSTNTKLKTIKIKGYKNNITIASPYISKGSVLYIIQNASSTSAITITLHADAFARFKDDEDIIAALAAQPLITLASA